MVLPYYMRLVCLCLATFFIVHGLAWVAVRCASGAALRVCARMAPRSASSFLFGLRMTPVLLTLLAVFGYCVPSYLWLEPDVATERVGLAFLAATLLGIATTVVPLGRAVRALLGTNRYLRACGAAVSSDTTQGFAGQKVTVVDDNSTVMAAVGIWRHRIVVSRAVLEVLSEDQKDVALCHERAHAVAWDNLKKLLLLLTPDVLPFASGTRHLERNWIQYTEWAADDEAVAGDTARALFLASALVRIAKLGTGPTPNYLLATFVGDDENLAARVERLLCQPDSLQPAPSRLRHVVRSTALALTVASMGLWLQPRCLGDIHRILERFLQ